MAMEIRYTNNTKEVKYFASRDAFRWFLGMNVYDDVKIVGYAKAK